MTATFPDITPTSNRVRSVITTKWGKSGYRPIVIPRVETYYVDTALDSDADTWTIEIGDPSGEYLDLLARDNEVRTELFGVGRTGANYLMSGIADEISYTEEGTITLTGRDYSSLATDSTVTP